MHDEEVDFFPDEGEVAALLRSKDWSGTAIGSPRIISGKLRLSVQRTSVAGVVYASIDDV